MEDRESKRMKKIGFMKPIVIELPEEICVEIVARLPFRSIMRFKSVCRRWREVIETSNFRRRFMFAHRNSSSSWSIMQGMFGWLYEEVVGFYGCERYGLSRSLDSYVPPHGLLDKIRIIACADGLVLYETIKSGEGEFYSVGNPVLKQWVQLPPHPLKGLTSRVKATGLVTRVEDGVVVEYKVVFMDLKLGCSDVEALCFDICSSKTGRWIRKHVRSPRLIVYLDRTSCQSLNQKLHWLDDLGDALVAYDFFAADEQQQEQQVRVIPFPDSKARFRRAYTMSEGFIVYINKIHLRLRLWRLEEYTSHSGIWKFMQEINLTSFGCDHKYLPVAMHPFETHIIYMSTVDRALVSIDLKTQKLTRHTKSSTYSDTMLSPYLSYVYSCLRTEIRDKAFYTRQFILPQWMESIPPLPSTIQVWLGSV